LALIKSTCDFRYKRNNETFGNDLYWQHFFARAKFIERRAMNRRCAMKKFSALAGLLTGSMMLAATPTLARTNVDVHIGIGVPGVYVYPAPVYPAPVYVHPQPVYVQPYPVYVQPRPVYVHPPHFHRHDRSDHFRNGRPHAHGHYPHGDRDRDGIPNRWDYRPHNPYRH
jgi:hypothetical protein